MVARHSQYARHLCRLLFLAVMSALPATAQQFLSFDVPGATQTIPQTINNLGQIVGCYVDDGGVQHGFELNAGVYSTIDYPNATATCLDSINDNGEIGGGYYDAQNIQHAFTLSGGIFTTINDPSFAQTTGAALDDLGNVFGIAIDSSGNFNGYTLRNGVYATFDFAGANETQLLAGSFTGGNLGGAYDLNYPADPYQGFTYINGQFATVNFPGSANTFINGINNNSGTVVGTYNFPDQNNFNVFMEVGGNFTTEDFPGAQSTLASNLNDLGQIIGLYFDGNGVEHGYLMTSGPFAYVANNTGENVSVIDIPSSLPLATIPIGALTYGVAISPDETKVYITDNLGVAVINPATNTVVASIPLPSGPANVAFTPDGTEAFVADSGASSVSVINTSTQAVVATVPVGSIPYAVAMAVTSNGTFAYVTSAGSNDVSVISEANNTVVQTINVGTYPVGAAVSPNSSLVYVVNQSSNNVSVISVATNTVIATISVGTFPIYAAFSPDGSTAYVTNYNSGTVSVIDTATSTVIATVTGFAHPFQVQVTADGTAAYVTDETANNVKVVSTATNTIVNTIPVGTSPIGIAIATAPPTTQSITQPLSPTQPNVFNFGTNDMVVQYPPGTTFSGVNMTIAAVEITQANFHQRVSGTQFAGAACIVYSGTGGNCVDYEVTCSDNSGNPIACPSESQPTIAVQTSFSSSQAITNPGYLTTPIGLNQWQNIFTGFSDPTVKGKTSGFSEFVAVDLGATNPQGLAQLKILYPLFPITFARGRSLPVEISLTSVANGTPITDAEGSISVVMIQDANGNPAQQTMVSGINVFRMTSTPGVYLYSLKASQYPAGTYNVTIYGNAFPAYQGQIKILLSK
jgi:YVTN family beta-propeller protein